MRPSRELTTRYERLRAQVRDGNAQRSSGSGLVVHQGLWAWMIVVATQDVDDDLVASPLVSAVATPRPVCPSPTVRHDLLAAWTDLVLSALTRQEARHD